MNAVPTISKIDRVSHLSADTFISDYLTPGRPVIVEDAMALWPMRTKWSIAYLAEQFGEEEVQIYDDLFNLTDICLFKKYISDHVLSTRNGTRPYMRWYSKLRNIPFPWADEAFERIKEDWDTPYFFPKRDFVVPAREDREEVSPHIDPFPFKGIFISGPGCATRRHVDPVGTDAVLCQVVGRKRVRLYPTSDSQGMGALGSALPDCSVDDVLESGEVLYIPRMLQHEVDTLSASVSVTWNFVHRSASAEFEAAMAAPGEVASKEIIRHFL